MPRWTSAFNASCQVHSRHPSRVCRTCGHHLSWWAGGLCSPYLVSRAQSAQLVTMLTVAWVLLCITHVWDLRVVVARRQKRAGSISALETEFPVTCLVSGQLPMLRQQGRDPGSDLSVVGTEHDLTWLPWTHWMITVTANSATWGSLCQSSEPRWEELEFPIT